MFKRLVTAALVFGAAATAPPAAMAQTVCGPHELMTSQLREIYGEQRKGYGLSNPSALYELWTNDATGSWTILRVHPNGIACAMVDGQYWTETGPAEAGFDEPA